MKRLTGAFGTTEKFRGARSARLRARETSNGMTSPAFRVVRKNGELPREAAYFKVSSAIRYGMRL
jgi:hypothetical protein